MQSKKTKIGCPTHGLKHMVWEGAAYYCAAPTPNQTPKKCFYHPRNQRPVKENKGLEKKRKQEEKSKKPDVFKMMEKDHIDRQKSKIRNRELQREKAQEKLIPAY